MINEATNTDEVKNANFNDSIRKEQREQNNSPMHALVSQNIARESRDIENKKKKERRAERRKKLLEKSQQNKSLPKKHKAHNQSFEKETTEDITEIELDDSQKPKRFDKSSFNKEQSSNRKKINKTKKDATPTPKKQKKSKIRAWAKKKSIFISKNKEEISKKLLIQAFFFSFSACATALMFTFTAVIAFYNEQVLFFKLINIIFLYSFFHVSIELFFKLTKNILSNRKEMKNE